MAQEPQKIDEQVSYNWLFFLLAGAFGAVTFWAVWDEAVTRREYKTYQELFFKTETDLAQKGWDQARGLLMEKSCDDAKVRAQNAAACQNHDKWAKDQAELKTLETDLRKPERARQLEEAKAKLQELEFTAFDKQQQFTFTKSNQDEVYYYFTLAKHHLTEEHEATSPEFERRRQQLEAFTEQLAKDKVTMEKAAAERDQAKQAVESFTARIDELHKEIEDLERPVKELERKYLAAKEKSGSGPLGLFGPATEIVQQNIEELERVDRCESCHMGSSRGGFETVQPDYFRSHPYRRTLLGLHPVEKFGCTTCHDGQGRATTLFYAHAPTDNHHYAEKHFWETPLLKGAYMESECRQCHRQEVELRANLRCESKAECPSMPDDSGKPKQLECGELKAPINPVANITAANHAATLEAKPEPGKWCGTPNAEDDTKIDAVLVDLAPHLARGRKIIEEAACYGCHPIEGYETKPKAGPDLRHVASKIDVGWMVEWILNPKAFRPHTRMPNFFPERLHPEEYPETAKPKYVDAFESIAKVEEKDPAKRAARLEALEPEHFQPEQQAVFIASWLLSNATPFELPKSVPAGDAKRGEELVDSLGCYGCHNLSAPGEAEKVDHKNRASHYDHGPDLGNIGSKTTREWIYAWIKDPKAYAPDTRMPSLRLTDQEAADIATFLAGNKFVKGKDGKLAPTEYGAGTELARRVQPKDPDYQVLGRKLVTTFGCYGCHLVKGLETTPGIGAELTEFGIKEVSRLDYGDYIVKHTEQTWESWLTNKLKHPRVYRYERVDTRMPQFDLCGDPKDPAEAKREECKGHGSEIEEVMVVLKGMRGRTKDNDVRGHKLSEAEAIRERGRSLMAWYNCYGCHTIDAHTGDIRSMKQFGGDEGPRFAPPVIMGEGAKTQPGWLFEFLKAPIKLRPHLKVRMPTFGFSDEQATTFVGMFSALDGAEYPYRDYRGITLEGARKAQAQTAFAQAQCTQCHTLGDNPSPEIAQKGAPNLLLTKSRLRPEWLARWIRDPQVLYPGVNMPSFFSNGNPLVGLAANPATANLPGAQELSKMSAAEVIYLLRDFLMTLGPAPSASAPAAPVKPAKKAAAPGRKHASRR